MIFYNNFWLLLPDVGQYDHTSDDELLPPPESMGEASTHFSHYNPISWEGKGVTITFCSNSPRWERVTLNGEDLRLHGEQTGREMWTNYDFITPAPTRVSGTIEAFAGTGSIVIAVTGEGTYWDHTGDCFGA